MKKSVLMENENLVLVGVYKCDGEFADLYQVQGDEKDVFADGAAFTGDIIYESPIDGTIYILDSIEDDLLPVPDRDCAIVNVENKAFGDITGYVMYQNYEVRVYTANKYQDRDILKKDVDTGVWEDLEEGVVVDI